MLLLDTHALIWLDAGMELTDTALVAIELARANGGVLVSAVSAWEIGALARKGRLRLDLAPSAWMRRFLSNAGVRSVPLSIEAAIEASGLPQPLHSDPADRLLIATARELGIPLLTRDRLIHKYAAGTGAVRVIGC